MALKFTNNVSLEDSLIFESVYPENLRFGLEDKQYFKEQGAEFLYLIDADGKLIGETYFLPLDVMQKWEASEDQPEDGLDDFYGKNAAYCYSNTVLPEYQGQGYGRLLKSYFLGYLKGKGYELSLGHARDNGSIKLNKSFGAEIVRPYDDWYKTGETYYLYKQEL